MLGDILGAHISPCPLYRGGMSMMCPLPSSPPGPYLVRNIRLMTMTITIDSELFFFSFGYIIFICQILLAAVLIYLYF